MAEDNQKIFYYQLNRILKFLVKLILATLFILIIAFNYSLYYQPNFTTNHVNNIQYNEDVHHQLIHLKIKLRQGAGNKMQTIFPEGFVFINALYGLSWTGLITNQPKNSTIYKEGINETTWALNEIHSPSAKNIFDKELPLEYGAFYKGWSNYLLGKKLEIQSSNNRDSSDVLLFIKNCKEISQALNNNNFNSPYLESYIGQKWPADGIIAVASLNLYDKIFKDDKYKDQLNNWLNKTKQNLDKTTGLIPHSIQAGTDKIIEGARGSSQSLILNFLKDIDETFAKEQFQKYKNHFLDWRLGLPGIREYPKGTKGYGDIDSGPVLLDIGGAASIVGQRTMAMYGDWLHYKGLRNCIETFGMRLTFESKKKYLFGQLPMADAFIAWSNSIETQKINVQQKENWRIKVQLVSLILLISLGNLIYKL